MRMQRFVVGVLAVALLGAGATVALVDRYIDQRIGSSAAVVGESKTSAMVLVAKQNLPIGTKISAGDLAWQSWPPDGVQSDFLSAPKPDNRKLQQIVGAVARHGIIKGTPITKQAVFKSNNPGFLAGALDPNMRAMAIAINAQSGAAGFILPGDRVDVILIQDVGKKTRELKSGNSGTSKEFLSHVAETILQNVRVLASDQKISGFDKKAKVAKTVTLEVTRKQAETLALAGSMGKLSLALRSFSDVTNEETTVAARKKAIAEAAKAAKGPTLTTDLDVSPLLSDTKQGSGIRIYRGGPSSIVKSK